MSGLPLLEMAERAAGPVGRWTPAVVHRRDWIRAGILGALARGRVVVLGAVPHEVPLTVAAFGHEVIGLTPDAAAEEGEAAALALGLPCRFEAGLSLPDATADSVVVGRLGLCASRRHPALDEALRLCRPGGRILVSVPDADDRDGQRLGALYGRTSLTNLIRSHGGDALRWSDHVPSRWLLGWFTAPGRPEGPHAPVPEGLALPVEPPLVSVVVPTYNRAHLLRRTLDSIFAQRYPRLEVLVVDDGSSDATASVVARHPRRPRYLRKENGGKASALNAALPLVEGRYLWIADDDDLALPYKLAQQVRVLEADPETAFVYGGCLYFQGAPRGITRYLHAREFAPERRLPSLLDLELPTGQTALYRTGALREAGPFDETLVRSQDLDMWIRLARRHAVRWIQFPTLLYRAHGGLRGAARERFSPEENAERWLAHNRRIYRAVYTGFALSEVDPRAGDGSDPGGVAAALVFRARVMLKRRLVGEATSDLARALDELRRAPALGAHQAGELLEETLGVIQLADSETGEIVRVAGRILRRLCQEESRWVGPALLQWLALARASAGPARRRYLARALGLLTAAPLSLGTWQSVALALAKIARAAAGGGPRE